MWIVLLKSAVALGTIEVRSNPTQDLSGLSRDPSGTLNALGKIFDKKTVEEQRELSLYLVRKHLRLLGIWQKVNIIKQLKMRLNIKMC